MIEGSYASVLLRLLPGAEVQGLSPTDLVRVSVVRVAEDSPGHRVVLIDEGGESNAGDKEFIVDVIHLRPPLTAVDNVTDAQRVRVICCYCKRKSEQGVVLFWEY